jgi:hypothetical protein
MNFLYENFFTHALRARLSGHKVRRVAEKQMDKTREEYVNKLKECINFEHANRGV